MAQKDETTYDFPKDFIKAQDELEEVRGELKILLKKQPLVRRAAGRVEDPREPLASLFPP
ncbi:hypothetical protein ACFWWT_46245 [Streptomyces sp. NPDC058676]|uniref:hypothetical protein n=1 Tax=unclassified Streptomyces TaxID=2593676 RepID=UPI003661D247